jgi:glycosyltransferase involved in cell wall biosynthesis
MHFFPSYGGQETYIALLNTLLIKSGIETNVVQPYRINNIIKLHKPKNVHFLPGIGFLAPFFTGIDWFWFNYMLLFKKSFLKSQDVVISHYAFHYPAISWHRNVIVVSHGLDWNDETKSSFDKYKKYAAELIKMKGSKIVANDTCFLRKLGINAKEGARFFEEITDNVWFIPNCIDPDKFYHSNKERDNIILVPRNIRKSRGIHLAIESFHIFSKKHSNFEMIIAGGPLRGKYYQYCLGLVKQYALQDKIHFIGNIPNENLIEIYNKSKITLIPTVAFEGTSISALESMACKTPVVSTMVGGLQDLPTWKVEMTPNKISDGLEYVLNKWDEEAERQYHITTSIFTLENWKKAWLKVINR